MLNGSAQGAVLYVVHRLPYPPDKGDRIRAFHLLKCLASKVRVYLACLSEEPVESDAFARLREYCAGLAVVQVAGGLRWCRALSSLARGRTVTEGAFQSRLLAGIIQNWARAVKFDCCLASASGMVRYLTLEPLRQVPAIVDLVDVDSQKWFDYAAMHRGPGAWLYRLEGQRLRRLERSLAEWARAVVLVSEAETQLYRTFCPQGNARTISNGVDTDYFRPRRPAGPLAASQSLVFVGALNYYPNVDGACWFCNEVWPTVRRRFPGATMRLVGRQPSRAVRRLASIPGVEVVGQVADVRAYVAEATASVVPLRIARGVQNKVLESLAMGKAVLASPQAIAGLGARPGVELLVASSPDEWAQAVAELLENERLRRQLGSAGRHYVELHHQWDRCTDPLVQLVGSLAGATHSADHREIPALRKLSSFGELALGGARYGDPRDDPGNL